MFLKRIVPDITTPDLAFRNNFPWVWCRCNIEKLHSLGFIYWTHSHLNILKLYMLTDLEDIVDLTSSLGIGIDLKMPGLTVDLHRRKQVRNNLGELISTFFRLSLIYLFSLELNSHYLWALLIWKSIFFQYFQTLKLIDDTTKLPRVKNSPPLISLWQGTIQIM